ncbi:MAG: glycogen/starch/alpha-glucan phosphorylase [Myxococcota bacterium]
MPEIEDDRTGMSPATLRRAVVDHLRFTQAKTLASSTTTDAWLALAHAVRDRLVHRWMSTAHRYHERDVKRVNYLSAEYLLGRQLEANLLTLGVRELAEEGLASYGVDLERVLDEELDPGLGNGGLGRLAACFMDSLATLELPAMGYGIRYEFGIFRQSIVDGWQVEQPDEWLRRGNPWEIPRPEYTMSVPFGGHVEQGVDPDGQFRVRWREAYRVQGVPYDMPVAGFGNNTVHTLRLWSARASEQFDLAVFNDGDYRRAVERKALDEAISKVLYPKDTSTEGKKLRLKQQFFFVCCSIADILRRFKQDHSDLSRLPEKVAIQLNDTHPSIAVAELMRVLVDLEEVPWDEAWDITVATCAYTNHTLLPEALERWPVALFEELLPRHLQIVREIDRRFLRSVHVWSRGDEGTASRMAIVDEGTGHVRMAHLAVVGSHTVNGVAELHGRLLREEVLGDFASIWPERFTHVTNGVTPRRWLLQCNPLLAAELNRRLGGGWMTDLDQLDRLAAFEDDPELHATLASIKRTNKQRLAKRLARWTRRLRLDPSMLLDVQIKRIHEYKRQLMCCLHVMWLYHRLRFQGDAAAPRTVLVAGKAAPGYVRAKQHVKLLNDVSNTIAADPQAAGRLSLLFVPDYDVTRAESIIPAAELSEQISLAGKEASGTGNMKLMMNGALTIGTLDGANVEIRQAVGADAFFLFGLDADRVRTDPPRPSACIAASERLQIVLGLLDSGFFNPEERGLHAEIARYLREEDPFLVCADFDAYVEAQEAVEVAWADPARWGRMVVRNIAHCGRFSSDRAIAEYGDRIWGLRRTPVDLLPLGDVATGPINSGAATVTP